MDDVTQRCTDYLSGGGLFNPELADHDAVRDLIIDCRDYIERLQIDLRLASWSAMEYCKVFDDNKRLLKIQDSLIAAFRSSEMDLNPYYTHNGFNFLIAQIKEGKDVHGH